MKKYFLLFLCGNILAMESSRSTRQRRRSLQELGIALKAYEVLSEQRRTYQASIGHIDSSWKCNRCGKIDIPVHKKIKMPVCPDCRSPEKIQEMVTETEGRRAALAVIRTNSKVFEQSAVTQKRRSRRRSLRHQLTTLFEKKEELTCLESTKPGAVCPAYRCEHCVQRRQNHEKLATLISEAADNMKAKQYLREKSKALICTSHFSKGIGSVCPGANCENCQIRKCINEH